MRIDRRADWFGLDGEVDGERVKLAVLLQAVRANRGFVEIEEGRRVAIADELHERLGRLEPMVFERRSGLEVSGVATDAVCELAEGAVSVEACAEWDALVGRLVTSRDQAAVDAAGALYRQWHPSHGLDVNDALLAATAMQTGGRIYTLNVKHYPMQDVLVTKAW